MTLVGLSVDWTQLRIKSMISKTGPIETVQIKNVKRKKNEKQTRTSKNYRIISNNYSRGRRKRMQHKKYLNNGWKLSKLIVDTKWQTKEAQRTPSRKTTT